MIPFGLSEAALSERLGVGPGVVRAVLHEDAAITGELALRLGKLFGMTPEFWINVQKSYELRVARRAIGDGLKGITPIQSDS